MPGAVKTDTNSSWTAAPSRWIREHRQRMRSATNPAIASAATPTRLLGGGSGTDRFAPGSGAVCAGGPGARAGRGGLREAIRRREALHDVVLRRSKPHATGPRLEIVNGMDRGCPWRAAASARTAPAGSRRRWKRTATCSRFAARCARRRGAARGRKSRGIWSALRRTQVGAVTGSSSTPRAITAAVLQHAGVRQPGPSSAGITSAGELRSER